MFRIVLAAIWILVAGAALASGLDYWRLPLQERAFSEMHADFSPAGPVGHGLGVVGTAMITIGVALYMARKRIRALARLGRLKYWLEFHIFLCTLGPFLVLLHTSFKFGGIVSIAFWSMVAVVASGVFGRYVYVWIPKTLGGQFRSLRELEGETEGLLASIVEASRLPEGELRPALAGIGVGAPSGDEVGGGAGAGGSPGLLGSLAASTRFRLGRRGRRHRTLAWLAEHGVPPESRASLARLAERRAALEQQVRVLAPFQRLFRYWHAFHLPLAVVMFLILIVHVAVAVAFGYVWVLG
jgi:hypothetical protein